MLLPSNCSSLQNVPSLVCSSPQSVHFIRIFLPAECSSPHIVPLFRMFLPSECSFLQNVPSHRMFLPSNCSSLQNVPFLVCSSTQNVHSFRTLQKAPPLKLFLPSEKPPFKIFLHYFSIHKVSHFRMFRIPVFYFLQNVFHPNVPLLKAILPSECSSLESVPPLRMFLP
jgi:hypothetical protein